MLGFDAIGTQAISALGGDDSAPIATSLPVAVVNLQPVAVNWNIRGAALLPTVSLYASAVPLTSFIAGVVLPSVIINFATAHITQMITLDLPAIAVGLSAPAVYCNASIDLPSVELLYTTPQSSTISDITIPTQRVYRAYLDGIEIPITSIQMRLRRDTSSYLSVVVPDGASYAELIAAHADGELRVMQGSRFVDGTEQLEILAIGHLTLVRGDRGATSHSITLTAYGENASINPHRRELRGVSYVSTSMGKTTVRATPDAQFKPADIAVWDGGEITAALVTLSIGVSSVGTPVEMMEISN